jgi:tetratricopeptide (TPR) repeat protein
MPGVEAEVGGRPCADEIRAALARMAESESFRGSPQLVAFLRYVVEATLRGAADRIKGYTIAVEALGRTDDFDPQADPIVRVEAMRLRRALTRYYDNGGKHDAVAIDLPLGSYVPMFRRVTPVAPIIPIEPIARTETPLLVLPQPQHRAQWRSANWRRVAACLALVALGGSIYGGLDLWFDFNTPNPQTALAIAQSRAAGSAARPTTAYPVVYVGTFQQAGDADAAQADRLRGKMRDALARFDEIAVISGPPPPEDRQRASGDSQASHYALTASVETGRTGLVSVAVRLADTSDGRIAFARIFERPRHNDAAASEEAIVREVAVALAQPYGIIHARERVLHMGSARGDPRYRCLIDSYDYWRASDVSQHARVRDCLERATAADPTFAAGFAALAEIVLQEHRRGLNPRAGDEPPLERALQAARRAVELKPGSARAYQALMDVHFLRGDHALALEAGEKAVTLNPYHPSVLGCYGARLIALGDVERGGRYVREAAQAGAVRPGWLEFYLFLASYLADDQRTAAMHASQIVLSRFSLGLLARALVAVQDGNPALAREHLAQLGASQPLWREDVPREIRKLFPADAVAVRLIRDLSPLNAGLAQ